MYLRAGCRSDVIDKFNKLYPDALLFKVMSQWEYYERGFTIK